MRTYDRRGAWFTVVCVLLLGLFFLRNGTTQVADGPPQPGSAVAVRHATADPLPPAPAPAPVPHSAPQRITVPSVKVDAPLIEVGLDADGWVEPPPLENRNLAGWYRESVSPGERGTSVIVGHVDNKAGPAVFYELGALEPGAVSRSRARTDAGRCSLCTTSRCSPRRVPRGTGVRGRPGAGAAGHHLRRRLYGEDRVRRQRRGLRPPGRAPLTARPRRPVRAACRSPVGALCDGGHVRVQPGDPGDVGEPDRQRAQAAG